jgi:GTP-binding protein
VTKLYCFEGLNRKETTEASAGEIVAIAGMEDIDIGETLADPADAAALPFVSIGEPTIAMNFFVNDSPFAGQDGRWVTSRNLKERLLREVRSDVSLRVEMTETANAFKVSGRGELHLAILIETMRREGFEFQVSQPKVIFKHVDGVLCEPVEQVIIDVAEEYVGPVIENLGGRKGEMKNMTGSGDNFRLEFLAPSRGLIGLRGELLTLTRGTCVIHQSLYEYAPFKGEIPRKSRGGALVAMEAGESVAYALFRLQDRGSFFIEPGTRVYAGMVVGENNREQDIPVNVCKTKQLTNIRAAGSDEAVRLEPPRILSLDQAIEWLSDDEYLEVTPKTVRLRKKYLDARAKHQAEKAAALS